MTNEHKNDLEYILSMIKSMPFHTIEEIEQEVKDLLKKK